MVKKKLDKERKRRMWSGLDDVDLNEKQDSFNNRRERSDEEDYSPSHKRSRVSKSKSRKRVRI